MRFLFSINFEKSEEASVRSMVFERRDFVSTCGVVVDDVKVEL